jgi:hypothetical protein
LVPRIRIDDRALIMTVPETPSPPEPPRKQDGCLTAILVLVGIVLLLPGVCSLVFMATVLHEGDAFVRFAGFWLISFAIAAGGIWLIRYARRNAGDRNSS